MKRISSILTVLLLSVACGQDGHRGHSQNIGTAPANNSAAVALDPQKSREIVVELFTQKAFYEPSEEQIARYQELLKVYGKDELWSRIVTADHRLIVNDRIRILTGSDKPDDEIQLVMDVQFIGHGDTAKIDGLIRSFYLTPKDPDKSAPSLPPPASQHPECDIHKMRTWEYLDCLDKDS
jgi:hypothetical protein